jgi:uncharacterized membrane protein
MTVANILLLATAICVGLMSGLFYSYSCSVVPGLGRLPDDQYISAMQSINRAIQNPIFFISFFGALLLLPIATYLKYSHPVSIVFWLLLTGTIIYFSGAFLVTVFGNIPLINSLDKFDLTKASKEAISTQRVMFETKWNNLNTVRTISSLLTFICILLACLNLYGNNTRFKP